jgi:hypothetical protein
MVYHLSVSFWLPELPRKLADMTLSRHVVHTHEIPMPSNARLTLPVVNDFSNMTQSLLNLPASLSHNRSRIRDLFFEYIRLYLSNAGEIEGNHAKNPMILKVC